MPRGIDGNDGGSKRVGHDLRVEVPAKKSEKTADKPERIRNENDAVGFRRDEGSSGRPVGGPAVTGSAKLLDMMLTSDKASFVNQLDNDEQTRLLEREVAKRVGQLLLTTPYGAPREVAFKRIMADPFVARQMPNATWQSLELLHDRFPTIVPDPNTPLHFGAAFSPTEEGFLDVFLADRLTKRAGRPRDFFYRRYHVSGMQDLSPDYYIRRMARPALRLNTGDHMENVYLRRVIKNAPPTWGPAEIAEEFNKYLDFYGPMVWYGDDDTVEEAKERARMTADRVQDLMTEFPVESGAADLAERQAALRQTLVAHLNAASPGDNLYATLTAVCDALEASAQRRNPRYHPDSDGSHLVFAPPPTSNATLTADDLVKFLATDPSVEEPLLRLVGERQSSSYRVLAEQIAATMGERLQGASVGEIVAIMKHEDPVFNDQLVHHLVASFPDILGGLEVEDSPIKTRFLLANQVADAMEKMFAGATLDEVAAYLCETRPGFDETFPDFSGEDVRLLQMAYPFLPQWSTKPESVVGTSASQASLGDMLEFATAGLGIDDARELQQLILETLPEGLERGEIPNELKNAIDRAFARNTLELVARELGVERLASWSNVERMDAYQAFLAVDPNAPRLSQSELAVILSDEGVFGKPPAEAARIAKALHEARELDFKSLRTSLGGLLAGKASARTTNLELNALYLGRRSIHSELELTIYKNEELRSSFERFARIPLRLPMVQQVVDKYKGVPVLRKVADEYQECAPFEHTNVMFVQHMLGQAYPQISGFKQLGMDPTQAIFVGIPYHKNNEVELAVAESFGVDVRVSEKDVAALYKEIERGIDDTVKRFLENGQDCLIVADGPYAREYFRNEYLGENPEWAQHFRFTEQTAFGDRPEYRSDTALRTVSYARRELKAHEAEWVGTSVVRAVGAVLNQMGTGADEKPVLIMGGGPIGRGTAEAFLGAKADVMMYDPNPTDEMTRWALENDVELVSNKKDIVKNKFLLVGCSGYLSLDEEAILDADSNSILVSASSKLVEIDMKKLREMATDEQGRLRRILAAEVNNQQTWHYWLKDGTIRTVIADGLPANFNDINSVPPELIDTAMSMSLASAVQAMTGDELGFFDLNDEDHEMLADHFENHLILQKGLPPFGEMPEDY